MEEGGSVLAHHGPFQHRGPGTLEHEITNYSLQKDQIYLAKVELATAAGNNTFYHNISNQIGCL